MTWLDTLATSLEAMRTHRMRSALTVLGILIGIAAVILTVGLGIGAQQQVTAQVEALGTNLLIISPGSTTSTTGLRGGFGSASTLTQADAQALASPVVVPDIAAVAPTTSSSQSLVAGSSNWTTSVVGTTPSWLSVRARTMSTGAFLTNADQASAAPVVVLGATTATELFGSTDVVGQSVTIAGTPFTVQGVLAPSGSTGSANNDDTAVIPLSTAQQRVSTGTSRTSVQTIYVQATSQSALSSAYQEANAELLSLHGITNASNADFTITNQASLVTTAASVSKTLTVLLAGIAAISLLVGGIGVMNIMLVSVTERIREIGLRKALGARPSLIRRQFLIEAALLGLVGGLLGAAVGILGAKVLPDLISNPVALSMPAIFGSITVALAIGLVFGVYPASRAAQLAPIDALRSE
ncbi:MAG TPA: ABC transporter permease [Dermatophilaceae bacterium]|jgi:putative ABC transport system permease protein